MSYKHGQARRSQTTSEYQAWCDMKNRCLNPNNKRYKDYGGRGITVCSRWLHSFENFFEDMGKCSKGLTLERIDNDGNYKPENCCYATQAEQNNNQRKHKDRKSQFWFYGHGPNGEIIIENNQRKVARCFELDVGAISCCLSGKYKQYKGWKFQRLNLGG